MGENASPIVRKGTIVVATRDDALVSVVRGINADFEMDVDVVSRGQEVLRRLGPGDALPHEMESGWIKILILDEDLVDGKGRTMLPFIRETRPDLKVIFTARVYSPALEVEVRREGAYFFLPKPVSAMILHKVVAKAVEHESTRNWWKTGTGR